MSNSLGEDISPGDVLVLREDAMKCEFKDLKWRLVEARGGFGLTATTLGRALYVKHLTDGEEARYDSHKIERRATAEEVKRCIPKPTTS